MMWGTMIKKIIKNIIVTLFFVLIFPFCINAAEQKKLIVGVSAQYPPFVFMNEGQIVGFEVDLVNILADNLGYNVQFEDMYFKELFSALKSRKVDIAIATISATKERRKFVDFSYSYYFPELAVLTLEKNNINSIKDLQGRTVATITGTVMEEFITRTLSVGRRIKLVTFSHMDFMLNALNKGEIDAIVVEDAVASYSEKVLGSELSYFVINYPKYAQANSYAIALQKNSTLINEINNAVLTFKMSEDFNALKKKWGIK